MGGRFKIATEDIVKWFLDKSESFDWEDDDDATIERNVLAIQAQFGNSQSEHFLTSSKGGTDAIRREAQTRIDGFVAEFNKDRITEVEDKIEEADTDDEIENVERLGVKLDKSLRQRIGQKKALLRKEEARRERAKELKEDDFRNLPYNKRSTFAKAFNLREDVPEEREIIDRYEEFINS